MTRSLDAEAASGQALFDALEEGVGWFAPDGAGIAGLRCVRANPAWHRLCGGAEADAPANAGPAGEDPLAGLPAVWRSPLREAAASGAAWDSAVPQPHRGRWLVGRALPVTLEDGTLRLAVLLRDVTRDREAEDAAREREARLRLVADVVPDLLWSSDAHRRVDWCNERMRQFVGHDVALGIDWAPLMHPDDHDRVREGWLEAMAAGTAYSSEHRVRDASGEYRWYLVRAEPLRDAAGAVSGWIGAMTDVHEQRAARELLEARVHERTRELRESAELRRQLLARLDSLQDEERRRIARELHDALGQQLTAVMLAVSQAAAATEPDASRAALARVRTLMDAVDTDLDRLVFQLRPTGLEDGGLEEGVAAHARTWSQLAGVPVDFLARGLEGRRLPLAVEAAVFRVIQESLTNVAKHARATQVALTLEATRGTLRATIEDDGRGFDLGEDGAPNSWGLLGMRERIESLGGRFAIESAPGAGTTVLVQVPLRGEAAA